MAFNLPPPWDPGYALPENVSDEGLERRGFVTRWMPRGTYDATRVGTGGYAVPKYVQKEGYGQGAVVTKWAPRGRYDIPVPNWLDQRPKLLKQRSFPGGNTLTFDALSGTDLPALYTSFGKKAARAVLARVAQAPPAQRKQVLKAILDGIDPKLWARTAEIGQKYGLPIDQALARAMSSGIAAEVVDAGLRRALPQPRSLLGLGHLSAMGAWDISQLSASGGAVTSATITSTSCAPPPGYTWDPAGYWRVLKVGETPKPSPTCGSVTAGGPSGGTDVTTPPTSGQMLQLGPSQARVWFSVPVETRGTTVSPIAQTAFELARVPATIRPATIPGDAFADMVAQMVKVSASPALAAVNVGTVVDGANYGLSGVKLKDVVVNGDFPIYNFQHPTKNKRYGLYVQWKGTKELPQWHVFWRENEPDAISRGLSMLKGLFASMVDLAKKAIDAVGDLACAVATSPGGQQAGATAGAASGAGAAIGQAGANIAAGLCSKGGGGPPLVQMPSSNLLPLAIAGGVALVAIAVLTKKKKAAP